MKKTLINSCMAMLLIAGATSCSNEEIVNVGTTQAGDLVLSATIGTSSRTSVDDSGNVNWVAGDSFYAWGDGSDATYTLHEGAGTTEGLFSGTLHNGFAEDLYHVAYPASAVTVEGTAAYINLDKVLYGNSSAPMYGTISSGNVYFANLTAMLRIRVNNIPADSELSVSGIGIAGQALLSNGTLSGYSSTSETVTVTGIAAGAPYVDVPVYAVGQTDLSISVNGSTPYEVSLNIEKDKVYQSPIPQLSYVNNTLALVWDGSVDTDWYDSSVNEFTLTTPAQLAGLAKLLESDNFKNKTIKLGASFDMSDITFGPIGQTGSSRSFSGTFDGEEHTISGLNVRPTTSPKNAGLFGALGDAVIKDLNITNSYFEGDNCGCVAGYIYGTSSVENVVVTNSVAVENGVEYQNRLIGKGKSTNGSVNVDGNDLRQKTVNSQQELINAVKENFTEIYLKEAEGYDLKGNMKNGLKLIGLGKNVKICNTTNFASNGTIGDIRFSIKLENMTITNTVAVKGDGGKAEFTNVTFEKGMRNNYGRFNKFYQCTFFPNNGGYLVHFETEGTYSDGQDVIFTECQFESGVVALGGSRKYVFDNCYFAAASTINIYDNIIFTNCIVKGEKLTNENKTDLFQNWWIKSGYTAVFE